MLTACPACHRQYDVGSYEPGAQVRCFCGELFAVPRPKSRQARMLHCSNCGGKLADGAKRCAYCEAEVQLGDRGLGDLCPECFARLLVDARYCSTCGLAIRVESVLKALSTHECPRCKSALALCDADGTSFIECTRCGGVWLDVETFERITSRREPPPSGLVAGGMDPGDEPRKPVSESDVRYVPCPVCKDLMNRKNFAGRSGVILDWCRKHGYWFDTHELEAVLRFIDAGGLEDARRREHERKLYELEKARRGSSSAAMIPVSRSRRTLADGLASFLEQLLF